MSNKTLKELIIASFFHDIGKFIQRSKKFEETHSQLAKFLFSALKKVDSPYKLILKDKDIDFDLISKLVELHHEKDLSTEQKEFINLIEIIKKADNLAAASQRTISEFNDLNPEEVNQKDIFSFLYSKTLNPSKFYLHRIHGLYELDLFLPVKQEEKDYLNNVACYKNLLGESNFGTLLSGILNRERSFLDFMYAIDDLFYLLYTQIPEDRRDEYQLNSLYDHLKLTTIFAYILYYGDNFHILKFDIAGIQKFIFDIKSKKAAKILRGRSLFVQILNEIINFEIIKNLDLIPQLILSSFGGNSIILLPDNEEIIKKLDLLLLKWKKFLLTSFGLTLRNNDYRKGYLLNKENISMIFSGGNDILRLVNDQQIFFELENINNDIIPQVVDDSSLCDFCNNPKDPQLSSNEEKRCRQCDTFLKLSDFLTHGAETPFVYKMIDSDSKVDFSSYNPDEEGENQIIFKPYKNLINRVDQKRNYFPLFPSKTLFYTVTIPKNKSFEDLVKEKKEALLLLYLKGDVDSMSDILTNGFDFRDGDKTLTDVLHFSRRINIFFQNYLPYLIETKKDYKDEVYLVYSGGDDFLLTGYWLKILEFLFDLKEEFDKFVCQNSKIHFSIGGVLAKPNDPVFMVVEEAESQLEKAKLNGKNQFAFLHSSLEVDKWQKLLEKAQNLNIDKVSTSFFYKLYKLSDGFAEKDDYKKTVSFYKMSYYYYRLKKDLEKDIDTNDKLEEFINFFDSIFNVPDNGENQLFKENFKSLINLILLLRRKGGEKNDN